MRLIVALFLPWLAFFTMGMVGRGIICLILQCTVIGWPIAAIWASITVQNYWQDKRTDRVVNAIQNQKVA